MSKICVNYLTFSSLCDMVDLMFWEIWKMRLYGLLKIIIIPMILTLATWLDSINAGIQNDKSNVRQKVQQRLV